MKSGVASLAMALALTFTLTLLPATNADAATPAAATSAASAPAAKLPKPPKPISVDRSASYLIEPAMSEKLWEDNLSARVKKLYPIRKFRFVSEVGGGFNEAKLCVVSARAMMLPVVRLPVQGLKAIYAPIKTSTAFDAVPNLSREQCQALARSMLKDAIQSVASALAAS
jgi:hypothetical protein